MKLLTFNVFCVKKELSKIVNTLYNDQATNYIFFVFHFRCCSKGGERIRLTREAKIRPHRTVLGKPARGAFPPPTGHPSAHPATARLTIVPRRQGRRDPLRPKAPLSAALLAESNGRAGRCGICMNVRADTLSEGASRHLPSTEKIMTVVKVKSLLTHFYCKLLNILRIEIIAVN